MVRALSESKPLDCNGVRTQSVFSLVVLFRSNHKEIYASETTGGYVNFRKCPDLIFYRIFFYKVAFVFRPYGAFLQL